MANDGRAPPTPLFALGVSKVLYCAFTAYAVQTKSKVGASAFLSSFSVPFLISIALDLLAPGTYLVSRVWYGVCFR